MKIRDFYEYEFPLIQNSNVFEFVNVSKFTNILIKNLNDDVTNRPICKGKSLGRDLTPRPNAYEAFALPG